MSRPTDRLLLRFPNPPGSPTLERFRWWSIRQPSPTAAFILQGKVAAALGDVGAAAVEALFLSPDQVADLEADRETVGEEMALRTLRRSRAGLPIADAQEGPAGVLAAQDRVWAVLAFAGKRMRGGSGIAVDALLGDWGRGPGGDARWNQGSILHRLLLASELQWDGEDEKGPRGVAVDLSKLGPKDDALRSAGALRQAVVDDSVNAFTRHLDTILASPDELSLLAAWAVLHLYRPF